MTFRLLYKTIIPLLFIIPLTVSYGQSSYPLTGHPRLLFLPEEEAVVKSKISTTPLLMQVHNIIIAECQKMLTLPVQQRATGVDASLTVSREATRRIGFLSYAFRMTGDTRFAARAETEMLAVAAFSDWYPSNQLSFTEMTLAMSIGYDWLYNYMGTASRTAIAGAIRQKGIDETTGTKANKFFLQDKREYNSNINSILNCNACIAAGVAALYDTDPAYYQPLIDRAVYLVKFPMEVYQYNGAYPESMMYWDYGTAYLFLMIDLLQHMWGTDRDLLKTDGLLKTGNFAVHMHGNATQRLNGDKLVNSGYRVFNFGDGVEFYGPMFTMYGLANFAPDQANMYLEMKKLSTGQNTFLPMQGFLPFLIIWGRKLSFEPGLPPAENSYIAQGKSAVAALRSGWNSNDIYLALKGGTPAASHCHMDAGSFVMDVNDVRWAIDYGGGTSAGTSKWDTFNFTNLAHNTITINGNKQIVEGYAPVENLVDTRDLKSVDINLTSLYSSDASSCIRTGAIVSNRFVEIKDVIRAGSGPLTVRWNMVTEAFPTQISKKIILLTQASKKLYLVFDGTDQVTSKNWSPRSPEGLDKNTGTFAVGFEYTVPAGTTSNVTVKLVPEGDPMLSGLSLTSFGQPLWEDFEYFPSGSLSGDFVLWKMNHDMNSSTRAILGEVVPNPLREGINTSNKVLKIFRQDDSNAITTSNAANYTYRGVVAYGYDLRLNPGSVVEFKYYKDAPGTMYVRALDGKGVTLGKAYIDNLEGSAGYSTARWRTAQVALGTLNQSGYSYTPSGSLMLSMENNGTEYFQEKELTVYLDDVRLLPMTMTPADLLPRNPGLNAFFDRRDEKIYLHNLPDDCREVRLFDTAGRLLQRLNVSGSEAVLDTRGNPASVYIVRAIQVSGKTQSLKVLKY